MSGAQEPIKAGMLGDGLSKLVFHALRPDGSAACSSYLHVRYRGEFAREIGAQRRCKSRACQKLFALADAQGGAA